MLGRGDEGCEDEVLNNAYLQSRTLGEIDMAINNLYSRLQLWHPRNAGSALEQLDVVQLVLLDTKGIFSFLLILLTVFCCSPYHFSCFPNNLYCLIAQILLMVMLDNNRSSLKM